MGVPRAVALVLGQGTGSHGTRPIVISRLRQDCVLRCWSERRDSNSGPPVPQTGALTGLRYAPPEPEPLRWPRSPRKGALAGPRTAGSSGKSAEEVWTHRAAPPLLCRVGTR